MLEHFIEYKLILAYLRINVKQLLHKCNNLTLAQAFVSSVALLALRSFNEGRVRRTEACRKTH